MVQGEGTVSLDGADVTLSPGDSIDIPAGAAHRMSNTGQDLVVFIEVQRGEYFGEDDIERIEDDFGRTGS